MKAYSLNTKSSKLLGKIDYWLSDNMNTNGFFVGEELVMEIRENISTILEKGSYNESEKQLLNELRSHYVNYKDNKLKN
tara:strand:- start:123 stop:359 length:237 start_codon:yes stop_codon:yes gene_type:complete